MRLQRCCEPASKQLRLLKVNINSRWSLERASADKSGYYSPVYPSSYITFDVFSLTSLALVS